MDFKCSVVTVQLLGLQPFGSAGFLAGAGELVQVIPQDMIGTEEPQLLAEFEVSAEDLVQSLQASGQFTTNMSIALPDLCISGQ